MYLRWLSPLTALALISSCAASDGTSPDLSDETSAVDEKTHPVAAEPRAPAAMTFLGFDSRGRFALFDGPDRTVVFDAKDQTTFALDGHVDRGRPLSRISRKIDDDAGFRSNDPLQTARSVATSPLYFIRDKGELRVVDLDLRGTTIARFDGETLDVERDKDGTLAAWAQESITFVDPDGTRTKIAAPIHYEVPNEIGGPSIEWHARTVTYTGADGEHLYDRVRRTEKPLPEGTTRIIVPEYDDALYFAVAPDAFELWHLNETSPRVRAKADAAHDFAFSVDGRTLGFTESASGESGARATLNVIDIESGARVHFLGADGGCGDELITRIERGEVHTDATCDTGCGGEIITGHTLVYNARTGKVLRETLAEHGQSTPNALYAAEESALAAAATVNLPLGVLVHQPDENRYLYDSGERGLRDLRERVPCESQGLALLDGTGKTVTKFAGPTAPITYYGFSPDGVFAIATSGARAFVWEVATGKPVFTL